MECCPSYSLIHSEHATQGEEVSYNLAPEKVVYLAHSLRVLLSDVFALYLKTKNFQWHLRGGHLRDYYLLLDDQGRQLLAMTDGIAERSRKLGGETLKSTGDIKRHQRIKDNDRERIPAELMLAELLADNQSLATWLRSAHSLCEASHDIATPSLLATWIDETEGRTWLLAETIEVE